MAKSFALTADKSGLAWLLLSYLEAVCAFVALRQPGASTANIDRPAIRGPEGSALFFFTLPLEHRAHADSHGALFTQRRFFEAVLVAAGPQEQTRAGWGTVEVAFTEIAVVA